ncbi:MAG: class I SAM-dependent methyltransferase [Cyanobacteriota bacterium]
MKIDVKCIPYLDDNLLFLDDIIFDLNNTGIQPDEVLFRASELEKLDKILAYGTDRAGYSGNKIWRYSEEFGTKILHKDVIFATSDQEIINAENKEGLASSMKKFSIIDKPLFLVYARKALKKLRGEHYLFLNTENKKESLLAIYKVIKATDIQGWFTIEEGQFYRSLVNNIHSGTIAEIGSWKGRSTTFIAKCCEINNNKLFCIDNWKGSSDKYCELYNEILNNENVEEEFRRNVLDINPDINVINKNSVDAALSFPDKTLDMVFIDASHDYESVKNDLDAWWNKLKEGGIIAGHDYENELPELTRAVDEFVILNKLTLFRGPGTIWYINK